jgi:hypothetical protein
MVQQQAGFFIESRGDLSELHAIETYLEKVARSWEK